MTLVVCPNLAIDRVLQVPALRPGAVMRCRSLRQQAGGKGANVARALRALAGDAGGTPGAGKVAPVLLAGLAAGHGGRLIAELAADEGLDVELVYGGGEARVSTVVLTDEGPPTRLFEYGPEMGAEEERGLLAVAAGRPAAPGEWAVVDGAAPPGATPGFYGALVRALHAAGYRVVVDAEGVQLTGALAERPDVVKVNLAEAASAASGDLPMPAAIDPLGAPAEAPDEREHAGGEPAMDEGAEAGLEACRRLVAAGAGDAIVTLGAPGAVGLIDGRDWRVSTPAVTPVNTVGSGDCFAAALVLAFERGEPVEAALATAAGTAAANAAHPLTGHFDPALARDLAARARVVSPARRPSAGAPPGA